MKPRKIRENVYWVGAIDWDRRLFDSLIPLPDGTSYNSYLITGTEKTALVDTVDPAMTDTLFTLLHDVKKIDYIVTHHAEQDHSGSIPAVLKRFPEAKVVCTPKCKDMLVDHLRILPDQIITVEDGAKLSLGGKTLSFIHTPWVHWPETMVSYLQEDAILFSCDFFGSHIATTDLYIKDRVHVYEAAKRYYSEIMMPFRAIIKKNIEKIGAYPVQIIAPSHGVIYDDPNFIINAYKDWISDTPKNVVVVPFISMHGSTRKMVEYVVNSLAENGITVHQFDLSVTDIGKLAISLVDAASIIIGSPTVHVGPHPSVLYAAYLANALRPKARFGSIIGSYGWTTKTVEKLAETIASMKLEIFNPVMCKGYPVDADFAALDTLVAQVTAKHRELKLL